MDSWTTTHKVAIVNEKDQYQWFNSLPKDSLYMMISCEKDDQGNLEDLGLLGLTSIDSIGRSANISGSIFKRFRATPWAKRAWEAGTDFSFEMLNLRRLDAEVLEYNSKALTMELELGYVIEGRKRESVYKCGRYYDSIVLGLLYDEWVNSPRVIAMDGVCNMDFHLPKKDLSSRVINRVHNMTKK